MFIEKIDERHLKVELDIEDMTALNINRTSFAKKDQTACRVLKSILRNAYEQTGFDVFHTKMMVEIFPTINEGCILIFTKNYAKRFKAATLKRPNVYCFSSINNLLDCISALSTHKIRVVGAVYGFKNKFYLCLSSKFIFDKAISLVFSEFSAVPDKISPLFLKEHGSLVCEKVAL